MDNMNNKILALTIAASLALVGCGKLTQSIIDDDEKINLKAIYSVTQKDINDIAKHLDVNYRVVTNIPTDKCDSEVVDGVCFEVELNLTAQKAIAAKDWTIHFSHIAPIQSFESNDFSVKRLNGDLHLISLQEKYAGFTAGETKTLLFRAQFWALAESDIMPNFIVSAPGLKPRVIESTKPYIDQETSLEVLPHVESFTDETTQFKRSANDSTEWLTSAKLYQRNAVLVDDKLSALQAIIPTPKSINIDVNKGFVNISQGVNVSLGNVKYQDVDAALTRLTTLGLKQN
jgi:hexosaminidase